MTATARSLTCRELADFVADYLADELGPAERRLFDAHVAECPECAAYLQSYRDTIRLARGAFADDPAPADVPEALVRAILSARKAGG